MIQKTKFSIYGTEPLECHFRWTVPPHLVAEDLGRHVEVGARLAGQVGGGARLQPPRQPHVRHPRVPARICGVALVGQALFPDSPLHGDMRKTTFATPQLPLG